MAWDTATLRTNASFGSGDVAPVAQGQLPVFRPANGRLGPYDLVCELATGGMGMVYVARRMEETGTERTVTLKTIRSHLSERPEFAHMFVSEARVLATIHHPYVCKLWDVGTVAGAPYLAMEYLVGEPLSRLFPLMSANRSDFTTGCLVRTLTKLCEGLHAAHQVLDREGEPLKIVHRDISPQNLFLLYDGTVRILDFGVARGAGGGAGAGAGGPFTLAGTNRGKCAYMSPEQVRAQPVDHRTDVWSLGVVAWEMLAGRPLFSHESETKATVGVELGKLVAPSCHNGFVPPELDAAVMRALKRHPDDRFPDAQAFGAALEHVSSEHFGHVPRSALGGWLEAMFPGSREYRQRIVSRSKQADAAVAAGHTTRRMRVTKPNRGNRAILVSNAEPILSALEADGLHAAPQPVSAVTRAMQSIARWLRFSRTRRRPPRRDA